jgi:hypothetical protein
MEKRYQLGGICLNTKERRTESIDNVDIRHVLRGKEAGCADSRFERWVGV